MSHNPDRGRSVERRKFIKATGAGAGAVAIAGCFGGNGDGNGNGDDTETADPDAVDDAEVVLEWAADPDDADIVDEMNDWLHEQGLSEDIAISIVGTQLDARDDQYRQWLNAERSEPDLLSMDSGWTIPFIERGQLLNLSEELSSNELSALDDFFEASVSTSVGADGDHYGIPIFPDFGGMAIRKDLAEEAGYDPEGNDWATEPMSWVEFSQVVDDIYQNADVEYGYTYPAQLSQTLTCCTFNEWMSTWGGAYFGGLDNLYGPVGDRPITVTDEEVLDAIRMVRTFMYGHDDEHSIDNDEVVGGISPEGTLDWRYDADLDSFYAGDTVATRVWPDQIQDAGDPEFFGDSIHDQVMMIPFPYGVEESESRYDGLGGTATSLGGWNLTINPWSEHIEEALEVVRVVLESDEFFLNRFEAGGWLPPKPDLFESEPIQQDPIMGEFMDTLQVSGENAIPRPVTEIYLEQADTIAQEVHDALSRNKSPEQAMEDLEVQLEALEDDYAN